jgi:cysteine desulfurase
VVTYLPVDKYGIVSPEELKNAIRDDTVLIFIMFANNEIGKIQSVEEIGKIARENKIYFHTDAVQTIGHIPIDVNKMNMIFYPFQAINSKDLKDTGYST